MDWETFKEKFFIVGILLIIAATGLVIWEKIQFYRTIRVLNSITPQGISELRVYPKVSLPVETCMKFSPQEPIVEGFLKSVHDLRSHRSGGGSVISDERLWFLEVVLENGELIQMKCSILYEYPGVVIGRLGKFEPGGLNYGNFQSRQLFHWYQTYSHCWLKPENSPPPSSPH